jgi:hypothetical protein
LAHSDAVVRRLQWLGVPRGWPSGDRLTKSQSEAHRPGQYLVTPLQWPKFTEKTDTTSATNLDQMMWMLLGDYTCRCPRPQLVIHSSLHSNTPTCMLVINMTIHIHFIRFRTQPLNASTQDHIIVCATALTPLVYKYRRSTRLASGRGRWRADALAFALDVYKTLRRSLCLLLSSSAIV